MRPLIMLLGVSLAACSGRMEAGPIGKSVELRQYLPDSLRASAPSTVDSTYRQQIHVGPDSAQVEMEWTAFQHGPGRYLGTVAARLLTSAPYDSLVLGDVSDLKNSGSRWTPEEAATIRVAWFKKGVFGRKAGLKNFWFSASGKSLGLGDTR